MVRLSAATTIGDIDLPGTLISERISDYEVELEIDTEQCKMGEFLRILSEKVEILDISIKEIQIEKIISSIYEMDRENIFKLENGSSADLDRAWTITYQ